MGSRFDTLQFVNGRIEDFSKNCDGSATYFSRSVDDSDKDDSKYFDVLVALHACDVATDDALFYAIKNNADVILSSPCCHKQIRRQIDSLVTRSKNDFDGPFCLLEHGIFRERQSEMITDQIRVLLLSLAGYDTNIFEFISSEHTAKNIM